MGAVELFILIKLTEHTFPDTLIAVIIAIGIW